MYVQCIGDDRTREHTYHDQGIQLNERRSSQTSLVNATLVSYNILRKEIDVVSSVLVFVMEKNNCYRHLNSHIYMPSG